MKIPRLIKGKLYSWQDQEFEAPYVVLPSGELVAVVKGSSIGPDPKRIARGWLIERDDASPDGLVNMWTVGDTARSGHKGTVYLYSETGQDLIRTSGTVKRRDVRPGESFRYAPMTAPSHMDGPIVVAIDDRMPDGMPSGWSWTDWDQKPTHWDGAGSYGDLDVNLIPRWDAVEAGHDLVDRHTLKGGDAYLNEQSERVIIVAGDGGKPDDLPPGWLWTSEELIQRYALGGKVRRTQSYRRATSQTPAPSKIEPFASEQYRYGNSGRTYTFDVGENPFLKSTGWRPLDLAGSAAGPAFDPVSQTMVVHDLMEHFPGDEYAPHAEYMAQGAAIWLRHETGVIGSGRLDHKQVHETFGMLFHHILKGRLETRPYPADGMPTPSDPVLKTYGDPNSLETKTSLRLYEVIASVTDYIRTDEAVEVKDEETVRQSLHRGIPWMVYGYLRAVHRYAGLSRERLAKLFVKTAELIGLPSPKLTMRLKMDYANYRSDVELIAKREAVV